MIGTHLERVTGTLFRNRVLADVIKTTSYWIGGPTPTAGPTATGKLENTFRSSCDWCPWGRLSRAGCHWCRMTPRGLAAVPTAGLGEGQRPFRGVAWVVVGFGSAGLPRSFWLPGKIGDRLPRGGLPGGPVHHRALPPFAFRRNLVVYTEQTGSGGPGQASPVGPCSQHRRPPPHVPRCDWSSPPHGPPGLGEGRRPIPTVAPERDGLTPLRRLASPRQASS